MLLDLHLMPTGNIEFLWLLSIHMTLLPDMVLCLLKLSSVMLCLVTVPNAENVHYSMTCNVKFPFFEFYWEGKLQLKVACVLPVGLHNG